MNSGKPGKVKSKRRPVTVIAAAVMFVLSACAGTPKATIVYFEEQEGSGQTYRTRMIVSERYLRLDDADDAGDFVLFDRKQRVIYSTNSLDRRTLVIRWKVVLLKPPASLKRRQQRIEEKIPPIGDRPVAHHRLQANGEVCYDLYAVAGLLPDVVQAMREYHRTLATVHADLLPAAPLQTSPCEQVANVYFPDWYLQYGFPIQARDYLGRGRQLADYRTAQPVAGALFRLPEGYRQFTMEQARSGTLP